MRLPIKTLLALVVAMSLIEGAWGANSVVVESKTVVAGAKNVEVGIYLSNTSALGAVLLPFEIQEVTPGSYIADTLLLQARGRLASTLYNAGSVQYFAVQEDTLGTVGCWWTRARPDFVSPDMAHYVSLSGLVIPARCMPAGSDGNPPNGTPSLILRFNVTDVPGTFEIDQGCVGHDPLVFVSCYGTQQVFAPSFTKGVITIVPCGCDCHGDPHCDGVSDILDVMAIVGEAFGSASPIRDDNCGRKTRGDINCDCQVDILDAVGMIDVALRGKDASATICDGCSNNCP